MGKHLKNISTLEMGPTFLRDVDILLRTKMDAPVLEWLRLGHHATSEDPVLARSSILRKSLQNGCANNIQRWMQRYYPGEVDAFRVQVQQDPFAYLTSPKSWDGVQQMSLELELPSALAFQILKRWNKDAKHGTRGMSSYGQPKDKEYHQKIAYIQENQQATVDFAVHYARHAGDVVEWLGRDFCRKDGLFRAVEPVLQWRSALLGLKPERDMYLLGALACSNIPMARSLLSSGPWHPAWESLLTTFLSLAPGRWGQDTEALDWDASLTLDTSFLLALHFVDVPIAQKMTLQQISTIASDIWNTLRSASMPMSQDLILPELTLDA